MKKSIAIASASLALTACLAQWSWTPQDLAGTQWIDASHSKVMHPPGLRFERDGKVSGSSGCNQWFGRALLSSDSLRLEPMGMTRMLCDPQSNLVETRFVQALSATRHARLQDQALHLLDAQGQVLWRFTPHP